MTTTSTSTQTANQTMILSSNFNGYLTDCIGRWTRGPTKGATIHHQIDRQCSQIGQCSLPLQTSGLTIHCNHQVAFDYHLRIKRNHR